MFHDRSWDCGTHVEARSSRLFSLTTALATKQPASSLQLLTPFCGQLGKCQVELLERMYDRGRHDPARKPFVVRRDHHRRRVRRGGVANGVFVRVRIIVPALPLAELTERKLPMLSRFFKALCKALGLLLLRQVQKKLEDGVSVTREV